MSKSCGEKVFRKNRDPADTLAADTGPAASVARERAPAGARV
ncbi:MAG: hypothetical protein ACK5PZ_03920 [Pirellula sp.]